MHTNQVMQLPSSKRIACLLYLLTVLGTPGYGGTPDAEAETEGWHFQLMPLYFWAPGLSGNSVTPTVLGPVNAPINIEFTDALSNLGAVFTFHFEAGKDKWSLLADYSLVKLDPAASLPGGQSLSGEIRSDILELGGFYTVRDESRYRFELLAGARYTNLEEKFDLSGGPRLVDVDESWWDGFVGGRITGRLSDKWNLMVRGDIGGGGSDFTWKSTLGVDWRYRKWGSVMAGYQWLSVDYASGSGNERFTYDVLMQGPIGAFAFYW